MIQEDRETKYARLYEENRKNGIKNMVGDVLKPIMCNTCTNVLGVDCYRILNGMCDRCMIGPESTIYRDETEKIINQNMGLGKTRDTYIANHRRERAEYEKKYPRVIDKNYYKKRPA